MNHPAPHTRAVLFWAALSLAGLNGACSSPYRELRANVLDENGKPVPNSIFYAEAWAQSKCFDFAWAKTGQNGEVPAAGAPPLKIRWRAGARLALAAFAPGKKPAVVYDELGRVRADGLTLRLVDLARADRQWEPRLAQLAFPFPDNPELAARAAAPTGADLLRAFQTAYATLASERVVLPQEQARQAALSRLAPAPEPRAPNP
jgi:hypothetical protein